VNHVTFNFIWEGIYSYKSKHKRKNIKIFNNKNNDWNKKKSRDHFYKIISFMNFNNLTFNYTYSENSLQYNKNYLKFLSVSSYYLLPGINVVSTLSNLLVFIVIALLKFKKKFYGYLKLKSFTSMLIAIILIFNFDPGCAYCEIKTYNTFTYLFYEIYLLRISVTILATITGNFWIFLALKLLYENNHFYFFKLWPN